MEDDIGFRRLLEKIDDKLSACLVLLHRATTHDSFQYNLTDKSEEWRQAMRWATGVAVREGLAEVAGRQESDQEVLRR